MPETWVVPEEFIFHPGNVEGRFLVPKDSPWFSGHFPGEPILPGIALLGMVHDTLRAFAEHTGSHIVLKELKRIRFRQIVRPDTRLTVVLTMGGGAGDRQFTFACLDGTSKACDGIALVETEKGPS